MLIDVRDIAFFLIFCIIITVGVFCSVLLYNMILLVKRVHKIVLENESNINNTLSSLPDTVNNVNSVAVAVKDNINKAGNTIGAFGDTVAETAASVNVGTDSVLEFIKLANRIIKILTELFSKD